MDAIMLVLRTRMQRNALNATGVCSSSSAHRRFQEWEQAGVFHEIWRQGLLEYDEVVGIDWSFKPETGLEPVTPCLQVCRQPDGTGKYGWYGAVICSKNGQTRAVGYPIRYPTTIRYPRATHTL
jgi:hypothetical protein